MPKSLVPNQFDYSGIYVEGKRSQFRFHKPYLTSFMSGMLVPFGDPIPVFPGVKLDLLADSVIRSNTMVVPPLDGMYIDYFCVWVPHRIVMTEFPQFLGENDTTAWTQSNSYVYPYINWWYANKICDYLCVSGLQGDVLLGNFSLFCHYGLVTGVNASQLPSDFRQKHISVLAARGYYSIWNHFFRDENYQRPVLISKGSNGYTGEFGYLVRDYDVSLNMTLSTALGVSVGASLDYNYSVLMPLNKFHDYATSLLPQAQYGAAVNLPLGDSAPVSLIQSAGTGISTGWTQLYADISGTSPDELADSFSDGVNTSTEFKMVADLRNATGSSINAFRSAVMYQRYLEALARGGRRVPEYYEAIYGVKNSVAMKDYPEMLSHQRYILGVNQVVATADSSGSGWTSHLGDTGAYSLTNLRNIPICQKTFTEFGYLHILFGVRADNRYSQAAPEHFFREALLDEYNPYFDHIGDVDVPNYLVNFRASSAANMGFQEAWWFERSQQALATGALNKAYGSLAFWQLGENLGSSVTTCTPGYLCFDPGVFNDVFVSKYYVYPQFLFDGLIHGVKAGRMSAHSIPGIVGRI